MTVADLMRDQLTKAVADGATPSGWQMNLGAYANLICDSTTLVVSDPVKSVHTCFGLPIRFTTAEGVKLVTS